MDPFYTPEARSNDAPPNWHRPLAPSSQSAASIPNPTHTPFTSETLSIPRHISSPSEIPTVENIGLPKPPPGFENVTPRWHGVRISNLPRTVSERELNAMLLFAGDLHGIQIKPSSPGTLDGDYSTIALAQFGSEKSAKEAQERLDGKLFSPQDRKMSVQLVADLGNNLELLHQSASNSPSNSDVLLSGTDFPQYTTAATVSRNRASPPNGLLYSSTNGVNGINGMNGINSVNGSNGVNGINGASSMNGIGNTNGIMQPTESPFDPRPFNLQDPPTFFNPIGFQQPPPRQQRLFIPDDLEGDDVALTTRTRALTSPIVTGGRGLGSLPQLITGNNPANGFQNLPPSQISSPITVASPATFSNWTGRHLPPANPADQNPPCNTLYVGNLPANTTEDELKNLFCRQRGYKRLCFRAKQNGPMCFVEFEDIGMATKALTELYGRNLSTSVKGGIRLSFSKNPLGVRSHPVNGLTTPITPTSSTNQFPPVNSFSFSTASHNPPGLPTPSSRQMASHHQSSLDQSNGTVYPHHQMGFDKSNGGGAAYPHHQISLESNGNAYSHHQIGHERTNGTGHTHLPGGRGDESNGAGQQQHTHQFGVTGIPPHLIGK